MLEGNFFKKAVIRKTKRETGVLSDKDALRMGTREAGFFNDMIPESAPDPEDMLKARRRSIARQRRRSGRMSTILTGFGGQSETLG